MLNESIYKAGDWVVFTVEKASDHPGPRAAQVEPSPMGEEYRYVVDKYWVVQEMRSSGQVELRTRRGKTHVVDVNNPNLRKANLFERVLYRGRFPRLEEVPDEVQPKLRTT
jgi:hypothetical protein